MTPSEWESKPISDLLASDTPGFWGQEATGENDVAVLRSTNLGKDGRLDYTSIACRSFPDAKLQTKLLQPGDILLERSGGGPKQPVGRVALFESEGKYSLSNFMQRLRPNPKVVDSKYLVYALFHLHATGVTEQLQQATTGIRNLSYKDYLAWPLGVPPLPEQQEIAAILGSVDDAIQATQAVIDQTRKVKQGLLQQLLMRGIGHTRFKQTEIGEIPESWRIGTLGDFVEVFNTLRKPINAEERRSMRGKYPYHGPTGIIDHISEFRVSGKFALIGEDGDHFLKFDRWSMTQLVEGNFNVNNHAHIIQGRNSCTTEWIFQFFRHRDITSHLTRQGAGRYKLKKATLAELEIAVPPVEEQLQIHLVMVGVDSTLRQHEAELAQLLQTKNGLMQVLLTGRTRVMASA